MKHTDVRLWLDFICSIRQSQIQTLSVLVFGLRRDGDGSGDAGGIGSDGCPPAGPVGQALHQAGRSLPGQPPHRAGHRDERLDSMVGPSAPSAADLNGPGRYSLDRTGDESAPAPLDCGLRISDCGLSAPRGFLDAAGPALGIGCPASGACGQINPSCGADNPKSEIANPQWPLGRQGLAIPPAARTIAARRPAGRSAPAAGPCSSARARF